VPQHGFYSEGQSTSSGEQVGGPHVEPTTRST
jgi:hypothetical protein